MNWEDRKYIHYDWNELREEALTIISEMLDRWDSKRSDYPPDWAALENLADMISEIELNPKYTTCGGNGCEKWIYKSYKYCADCEELIKEEEEEERRKW